MINADLRTHPAVIGAELTIRRVEVLIAVGRNRKRDIEELEQRYNEAMKVLDTERDSLNATN